MSKYIEYGDFPKMKEITLADKDKCNHMYDEVCCNADSRFCADYPTDWDCEHCEFFEREELQS